MATFTLEIVTPSLVLLKQQVRAVRVPGIDGSFGVLAGHAPLMTAMAVGPIKIEHENGDVELLATSGGFVDVQRDGVVILADAAERATDIDTKRAEEAVRRARAALSEAGSTDYDEARNALARATNRLAVVQEATASQG